MAQKITQKKQLKGFILSHKMNKTAVVQVKRITVHQKYQKRYTTSKKFKAHDEKNEYKEGDTVVIEECRPLSKLKRWKIIKKV